MRKILIGILIVCLYAFPFVFNSMYQDYATGSMSAYLLMIVATLVLAFAGTLFSSSLFILIGNVVSFLVSLYCLGDMASSDRWGGYFSPLTDYHLVILVSILNLIPQSIAVFVAYSLKQRRT